MDSLESFLRVLGQGRKNPGFHVLNGGARKLGMEQINLPSAPGSPCPQLRHRGPTSPRPVRVDSLSYVTSFYPRDDPIKQA